MTNESMAYGAPLAGLTIVDLTRVLSGPFCTMLLADGGARVIKVEKPVTGDDARAYGPFLKHRSAYFESINRGKESIALDLKNPADKEVFEALLVQADVVTENFRPGVLDRLGYSWETLHARFPKLILASVSGFGQTGPYARRSAYDMVVQAMGGIMSVTGEVGRPPVRVGPSVGDITSGIFLALGICMAVIKRNRTGLGTRVDIGMLDCQVSLMEYFATRFLVSGEVLGPTGGYRPAIAPPFGVYQTQNGRLVIAAGNDKLFARLCELLGTKKWLQDARFSSAEARKDHVPQLVEELEAVLGKQSAVYWYHLLVEGGIPCSPVNTIDEVVKNEQVVARNMLVDVEDPELGRYKLVGSPVKISDCPDDRFRRPAPHLDQHRQAILREIGKDVAKRA